ncbi:MAG TPA: hypothetical protein VNY52_00625 [Solirubrobacteraceae bacterium]|nr:hypothetical protein [Solirubrobacteraceae bacterium]
MSLQDIYDALNGALHGEIINLGPGTVPNLELTLTAFGITGTERLKLTGASLTLDEQAVVLTGVAEYRYFKWSTTLTGESVTAGNRFTLALQGLDGASPWKFDTSFRNLPKTRRNEPDGTGTLKTSVIEPLIVEQPQLTVSTEPGTEPQHPRMQGWLRVADSELGSYVVFLAASRLRLDGTVDFRVLGAPALELHAAAPGADRRLPPIDVREVGLVLSTNYPDVLSIKPGQKMSAAALYARFQIGDGIVQGEASAPLLQGGTVWPLSVTFPKPVRLTDVMALVLAFFGASDSDVFSFPLVSIFDKFGLSAVEIGVTPPAPNGGSLGLSYALVAFESTEEWNPPIPFVHVRRIGTSWIYNFGPGGVLTGDIWGELRLYDGGTRKEDPVDLLLDATIPDFEITASTEDPIQIPLGELLVEKLGGSAGELPSDLKITNAYVMAAPRRQTYRASLEVQGHWGVTVNDVEFALEGIAGEIASSQSAITGSIAGLLSIHATGTADRARFRVSAAYRGDKVWAFEGGLADGTIKLTQLVEALLGSQASLNGVPEIDVVELWLAYESSGKDNPYSARGKLILRWAPAPPVLGLTLSLSARASLAHRKRTSTADELRVRARALARLGDGDGDGANMIYEGEVLGTFAVNRLAVTVGLSFVEDATVYLFEVAWGGLAVRAATEWVPDAPPSTAKHQALAISLRGLTLGEVVQRLAQLANPNLNYQLGGPWSVLNAIDLSRFALVIDPTLQTVRLRYDVKLELGFISVKAVSIVYDRSGGEAGVRFEVAGKMLGKEYGTGSTKPLSWDALNDPPPAVPGQGTRLFELRYLGFGQRVTLTGLTSYSSVKEVLRKLQLELQPVAQPGVNPLTQNPQLRFDEASEWLFGLHCRAMETVTLGLVLHDPDLYGVVVTLEGPRAGSLKGLEFELLYRKVTVDVGVFRVRLQVPTQFRQLDLGPVALTLGAITVEIFTNGNFSVDLGFPARRDFALSFGLQAGPFIGSGGIYFARLNGATSSRVPAVTNGRFDPVLELGVGLKMGVGRRVVKGALKAELSLQVVVIFEGVLGWFNPTNSAAGSALYYWAQGTAGIVGRLYGEVDFTVIRASLSVEAHAYATVTFTAHRATVLELDVGVDVNAEAEVMWCTVSFHFSMRLKESVTIGSDSVAPWTLAPGQSGRSPQRLLENVAPPHRRGAALMRTLTPPAAAPYRLNWRTDIHVFPDARPHAVTVKLLPAYSVDQVPVQWPGEALPAGSSAYRIAFLALADNGVNPTASSIAASRVHTTATSATAVGDLDTSFDVVIEAMLRWALSALGLDPVAGAVTAGQLADLAEQLEMPQTIADGFARTTKLEPFFTTNLACKVSGLPAGNPPSRSGATAFPMPPPLGWSTSATPPPDGCERRFSTYQPVDATYLAEVAEYFAPLDPRSHRPPSAAAVARDTGVEATESLASFLFRDYFLLVTKAAVQAALDLLTAFPYTVTGAAGETLSSICALFGLAAATYRVRAGDTVDQVAHFFGLSRSEALALNPDLAATLENALPGSAITVQIGATPESVAAANPDRELKPGLPLQLGALTHRVAAGETLAAIAAALGADVETWLLSSDLLAAPQLLQAGAPLQIPAGHCANPASLALELVAALLYVRLHADEDFHLAGPHEVPLIEWYAAAIATHNQIGEGQPLPPTLSVPAAYDNVQQFVTWATLPGDTLWRVAAYFAFAQNQTAADPGGYPAWLTELRNLNPGPGPFALVALPATATKVLAGETLADLAARIPVELPNHDRPESFRALVKGAQILTALTPLTIPGCTATTQAGQTLQSLAALYDLALEEVGRRLAGVAQLLATATHPLLIPHPGSVPIGAATATPADLVPAVLRSHGSTIGGQVSRFLLHGLRIPAPRLGSDGKYHATGALTGLFELTGQQLVGPPRPAAPPPPPPPPPPERMRVVVKVCNPAAWIELADSHTLDGEGSPAPELLALNPGLAWRDSPRGLVALTGPASELVFAITDADLWERYPATELSPVFDAGPAPLDLHRQVAVRHGLQQRLLWQTTEDLHLPNPGGATVPAVGGPTLWPFAADLRAAAAAFPAADFALNRLDTQLGPEAPVRALSRFAWGSIVQLEIRRIPGRPNSYELLGVADSAGRQVLLDLWQHLHANPSDGAAVRLLWQPEPVSGLARGYASAAIDPAGTYLIKTNLSTETHSAPIAAAGAGTPDPFFGPYYARPQDAERFLTLVWECSVVGGGGYWLQYAGLGGSPLPASIFAADGSATLTLAALLNSQCTATPPSRKLLPCNNCAVVGESLDASTTQVFAAVAGGIETVREATVQPGNVGFSMTLTKPPPPREAIDPQLALQRLYSLIAYQLVEPGGFLASNPAMPIGPQVAGAGGAAGGAPENAAEGASMQLTGGPPRDEQKWSIFQVLPIHRFAASHSLPQVVGLPDPAADPYAGIDSASTPQNPKLAYAHVALSFRELLGNASSGQGDASSGGPDTIDLPVGYTDPLVGLGAWPATATSFGVGPLAGEEADAGAASLGGGGTAATTTGAVLRVTATIQATSHVAGPQQRAASAAAAAVRDGERFARIYYQLMQDDVTAALLSTLEQPAGGEPARLALDLGPLRRLAQAACAWLGSAAQLADIHPDPTVEPTLAALSARHGVGLAALAAANLDVRLDHIFVPPPPQPVDETDLTIPVYATFRDGGDVAGYCPPGSEPATVLGDRENVALPLRPGVELVLVPSRTVTVPPDPVPPPYPAPPPPTLAALAALFHVTVGSLARANAATHGLLRVGTVLVYGEVEIEISAAHPDVSLDDVAATLTQEGFPCDAVMVAGANADVPGLLRAGATLSLDRYLVRDGESLAHNGSGATQDALVKANVGTVDLFATGTALYIAHLSAAGVLAQTLGEVAETHGLAPEQLLRHNRTVRLLTPAPTPADPLWPAIPGEAALPAAPAALRVPYAIPAGATLAGVAALFLNADPSAASAALALATANRALPGTLAADMPVDVDNQHVETQAEDSFDDLLGRFNPPVALADVVAFIADKSGYLAADGMLLCPPALLAGNTTSPCSPRQVAERYGVAIADLATANGALPGLVLPGVTLTLPAQPDGQTPSITTGAADTLGSLAWRFAQLHVQATPAEIVAANPDTAFLRGGATILLAPPPAILAAGIGASGWRFPAAIFPLHVWVELTRAPQLLDPGFADPTGPVGRGRSAVPPSAQPGADRALALSAFASELETSLPMLRVAIGAAAGGVASAAATETPADVWAVAFGAGQIASVQVKPGTTVGRAKAPRYYALRPLAPGLVSRSGVPIAPLQADGTLGAALASDYQGIDMETWAQRLLADVDLFTSAPYATGAYRSAKRASLQRVLAAKGKLAGAVADGLDYVLDLGPTDPDPPDPAARKPQPADWLSAREALRQRLLVGLLDGYGTDAVVQYDSTATTPSGTHARLCGPGKLPDQPSVPAPRNPLSGAQERNLSLPGERVPPTPLDVEERRASLSTAKTSLASGGDFVNFMLDVSREGHQRSVALDLSYPINELEFGIEPIVEGYDASSWLAFVRPFAANLPSAVSVELGQPEVPLPLRGYPLLPALLGQCAEPTNQQPTDYRQALRWDYICTFQHQSAAPDQLRLEVEFNRPAASTLAAGAEDDLFAKLAQYVAVAPELWAILEGLPDLAAAASGTPDAPGHLAGAEDPAGAARFALNTTLENAIGTFADLVEAVAERWSKHWTGTAVAAPEPLPAAAVPGGPAAARYAFTATLNPVWDATTARWYWESLLLERTHADGGLDWPTLGWFEPGGPVRTLGTSVETPAGRRYDFPPLTVAAYQPLGYQLRMPGLHVADYQSADTRVQVVRNAQLIAGGPPTRPAFVYHTPRLSFASPVAPLLSWDEPLPIGRWRDALGENPLPGVFAAIFDNNASSRSIACEIRYGYELGGSAQAPLVSHLPVAFRPKYDYAATSVQQIIDTVTTWRTANAPATVGGEWVFSLSMFSSVDSSSDRPLLKLGRLYANASN